MFGCKFFLSLSWKLIKSFFKGPVFFEVMIIDNLLVLFEHQKSILIFCWLEFLTVVFLPFIVVCEIVQGNFNRIRDIFEGFGVGIRVYGVGEADGENDEATKNQSTHFIADYNYSRQKKEIDLTGTLASYLEFIMIAKALTSIDQCQ